MTAQGDGRKNDSSVDLETANFNTHPVAHSLPVPRADYTASELSLPAQSNSSHPLPLPGRRTATFLLLVEKMASSSSVAEVIPTRADERDSVPDDSCIGIQYHNNSYGVSTEEAEEASSLANIAIDEDEEENNNKDNASAADQKTKAMKEKKPHQKHHKYQKQPKQPKQQKALSSSSASQSASSSSSSSTLADPSSSSSSSSPLDSTPTFTMTSLGCISSVYKLKYGTPRQGTIAPASRGSLTLHSSIPLESLEGLSEFSHIWLLFIFHRNTNKQFHSRIAPPRAKGVKYGVFATRTPHRINPVGLSLVKLDRIEKRTLFLSSLDLIQGKCARVCVWRE